MKKYFNFSATVLLVFFVLAGCQTSKNKIDNASLPRSTPEMEGVDSKGIVDFLDAAAKSSTEFHSFMFLRHGKIVAEGWWNPYQPDLKHTLYSTSKSFTSTAIGFAVTENLLTVNDKVISFFPDELPDSISPNLAKLEIKDLLFMSAGQDPEPTFNVVREQDNWVKAFLATPIVHEPGTVFLYNSLASYMLSAIVQKVSGKKVMDYLKPRLFEPLGIEGYDWEVDPQGINTGGWGLRLKTEDMAKFGQLYLQKGEWNGQQIIPAAWIEEATSAKIDQAPGASPEDRANNAWVQGYCYQFWRCRHNAYRADGAFGQYIIVMPDQDAVVAIQAESPSMLEEINLVWDYLLPAIKNEKLPANTETNNVLHEKLAALALPLPAKSVNTELLNEINGTTYALEENQLGWKSLVFQVNKQNRCEITILTDFDEYPISFGAGNWIISETTMLGPNLLLGAKAHYAGILPDKIASAYTCPDEHSLELVLRYIETAHTESILCTFDGNSIAVDVEYSQSPGEVPVFHGYKTD